MIPPEVHGGHDGEGKDGAGGGLGLGVILVAHDREQIVYNAEGRYDA
jgi:hypothetical protein